MLSKSGQDPRQIKQLQPPKRHALSVTPCPLIDLSRSKVHSGRNIGRKQELKAIRNLFSFAEDCAPNMLKL